MTAISVGLPVYNGQDLIRHAIDSILDQTFSNFELIISDNASTDDTESICRQYAEQDGRVKYFRNKTNIGAAANFRQVLHFSSSNYFKWIGVDDHFAPTYLEETKEILDKHNDVILCCSKVNIIDADGEILRKYEDRQQLPQDSPSERFIQFLGQDSWVNSVYGLMHADTLKKTSIMGTFTGSDVVVMAEMSLYGKFFELPDRLFFRRIHPGAYSYDCSSAKQQEFYSPGKMQRSLLFYRWRHLLEHYRSIRRAPIESAEKRSLLRFLLKTARWQRRELIEELWLFISRRN